MALSLAQDAKRALYDGLLEALPGTRITIGAAVDKAQETIIVGPQDHPLTFDQEWRSFGAGANRTEELEIWFRVEVFRGGSDPFEAEDRSWDLAEEVAGWLQTRPLESLGIFEAHPDRGEQVTEIFQDGRQSRITFAVAATGRVGGI